MAKDVGERLSIRLTADLARRLDRLQPKLAKEPKLAGLMRMSRSDVIRLALMRGVELLEREYK